MRILHLTDHFPPVLGGIEAHVAGLAERQAIRGHHVTVLTCTPRSAEGQTSGDAGPVEVIRVRSLLAGLRTDVDGFDLVHAHVSVVAPFSGPVAGVVARRGVPTVVTVHSRWRGTGGIPRLAASLSGMRSAPVVWTAVSRVAVDEVRHHLPSGTPVHVIANAVDAPARPTTREADGEVRLVSTMRIARRKRPVELLGILHEVVRAVSVPVRLTVVGDGPLRRRLEASAARCGLEDHLRITGRVAPAGVLRHLARSDVYVAPAVLESFGLAALEARSVGLPVVGRLDTGLADFIEPGVEGVLCATDTDVAAALVELAEDEPLRRRMAEHNRTVDHRMSWSRSLDAHERIYDLARGRLRQAVLQS